MVRIRVVEPRAGATETVQLINVDASDGTETRVEVGVAYGVE